MTDAVVLPRLRVLVIGAGRRVANNFLPALGCLTDLFELVGIHARTEERMVPLAKQWGVPAIADLTAIDWSKVDVVAISVPTSQNATVLRALLPHAARLRIVIDTPIFRNSRELAQVDALISQFKEVRVTEDFMNFPPYILLREAATAGLIGRLKRLTLLNTGFLYHGLALIRSFVNFAPVLMSASHGGFARQVHYRFTNGFRGSIIGPYRQYVHGGVVLEGTRGIITEVVGDAEFNPPAGVTMYHLAKREEAGVILGYDLVHGGEVVRHIATPEYARMRAMDIADKSELNLLRGCGLIVIFRALVEDNINRRYGFEEGFYDSMVSRLAARNCFPFDPLVLLGRNAMRWIRKISALRGA
jgi:hypothetical protein